MTTPPKMRRVAENDYEIGEINVVTFSPASSLIELILSRSSSCSNYRDTKDWKLSPSEGLCIRVQCSAG